MRLTKENKSRMFEAWKKKNQNILMAVWRDRECETAVRAAFFAGCNCGEANAKVPQSAEPVFTFEDV